MSSVVVTQADREAGRRLAHQIHDYLRANRVRVSPEPEEAEDSGTIIQAFARHRIEATAELVEAAQRVLAWWDRTLATKLLSHNDFPWAEDAEWDEFFTLRNVLKATRPVS